MLRFHPPRHFNPRSPHGERLVALVLRRLRLAFQSTLPARGATSSFSMRSASSEFQSTLPARGATLHGNVITNFKQFQSTLPARGATHSARKNRRKNSISIHAPRTGSDRTAENQTERCIHISIHAPRTGSDKRRSCLRILSTNFNPRSPHGERHIRRQKEVNHENFNPRSPHGERRNALVIHLGNALISIHAPRTGSDTDSVLRVRTNAPFQSTLPARGATPAPSSPAKRPAHFNPRSPHGERLPSRVAVLQGDKFQSTLPARGATPLLRWG